jgi:hypothetical protein
LFGGRSASPAHIRRARVSTQQEDNERATSFRITALEKDAIVGRHERISYDDILRVNARKTDDFKDTAMTILLTTAAVVVYVGMKVLEAESESEY